MKDRWEQEFFWDIDLETNTWIKKDMSLILDSDKSSVFVCISGSTSGVTC